MKKTFTYLIFLFWLNTVNAQTDSSKLLGLTDLSLEALMDINVNYNCL